MRRDRLDEHVIHGTIGFPVGIYDMRFDNACDILFPVHYHREFELFIVTAGSIRLQLEGEEFCLDEGRGIFINSGSLHSTYAMSRECGFLAIVFSPEFIVSEHEELYEKYIRPVIKKSAVFPFLLGKEAVSLAYEANEHFRSESCGYELFIKSDLIRIMALIAGTVRYAGNESKDHRIDTVKSVLDFIHENYNDNITLADMAEHAHISKEYLCRIFRELSDLPPVTYLNRYRIMRSAELLRDSVRSISEIALECGFNGSSYFNKLFLRFMKCTPKQYRRHCGGQRGADAEQYGEYCAF